MRRRFRRLRFWNDRDATAIRASLTDGFETSWNSHQPATAVTPDKCIDDAIFINTSGGWVKGREDFAEMISRLHAPREGRFTTTREGWSRG